MSTGKIFAYSFFIVGMLWFAIYCFTLEFAPEENLENPGVVGTSDL